MIIHAISDLHGHLPAIPPSDLLIIAGDIVPITIQRHIDRSRHWLDATFRTWLTSQPVRQTVACWGNHDFIGLQPEMIPKLPWTILQDEEMFIHRPSPNKSLRLYGTPWIPVYDGWAFEKSDRSRAALFKKIPVGLDILISHGPPHGLGDSTNRGEQCGDMPLRRRIEIVRPKVTVFGHIHEGRGEYQLPDMRFLNVSHVDYSYAPVHDPVLIAEF